MVLWLDLFYGKGTAKITYSVLLLAFVMGVYSIKEAKKSYSNVDLSHDV